MLTFRGWTTRQEQTIGLAPSKLRPRWRYHFHFHFSLCTEPARLMAACHLQRHYLCRCCSQSGLTASSGSGCSACLCCTASVRSAHVCTLSGRLNSYLPVLSGRVVGKAHAAFPREGFALYRSLRSDVCLHYATRRRRPAWAALVLNLVAAERGVSSPGRARGRPPCHDPQAGAALTCCESDVHIQLEAAPLARKGSTWILADSPRGPRT